MKKINKKKIFFVSITFLITLCLFFFFIFSYYSTPIQPRTIHKKNKKNTSYPTVSFVAVGDNIIHENVYQYQHGATRDSFHRIDHQIFLALWQWAKRRHSKKGKQLSLIHIQMCIRDRSETLHDVEYHRSYFGNLYSCFHFKKIYAITKIQLIC